MKFLKRFAGVCALLILVIGGYMWIRPMFGYTSQQEHKAAIFSHKTAGLEFAENSLEGFDASLGMDVEGIEIDVHMVKGGQFVLHHDPVLFDYNCFPKGDDTRLIVAQMTVDELSALDCVNHKVLAEAGETIPYDIVTLERFLDLYRARGSDKKLLLEIKVWDELIENYPPYEGLDVSQFHYPNTQVAAGIYRVLRNYPEITNVQFNTFSRELLLALRDAKKADESYEFGLLYKGEYRPAVLEHVLPVAGMTCANICWVPDYQEARQWLDANGIRTLIPEFTQVTTWPFSSQFEEHIMRDKGDLEVIPWTLNSPKVWSSYESMGFDGILTDKPTDFREWTAE